MTSRGLRWAGMSCIRDRRGAYRCLMVKTEGNGLPERFVHRWEDSIKTDLKKTGLIWLWIGTGSCEHSDENWSSIKWEVFLD
jgi:hypothetical protein